MNLNLWSMQASPEAENTVYLGYLGNGEHKSAFIIITLVYRGLCVSETIYSDKGQKYSLNVLLYIPLCHF